jgi:hypothetical protein
MVKSMRDTGMELSREDYGKEEIQKPVFVHRKASVRNISRIHEHFSFKASSKA